MFNRFCKKSLIEAPAAADDGLAVIDKFGRWLKRGSSNGGG